MPEFVSIFDCCTAEEADAMRQFLEKRGIHAITDRGILSGANTWGGHNYVCLKVDADDVTKSLKHLRRKFPKQFGDPKKIAALENDVFRQTLIILGVGLCLGTATCLLLSGSNPSSETLQNNTVPAILVGILGGVAMMGLLNRLNGAK